MSFPLISVAKFDCSDRNQNSPVSNGNVSPKLSKKTSSIKRKWTIDEDRKLLEWVEHNGTKKWSYVAKMLKGRTGKQCRERWHNYICPDIKKDPWSDEEYQILIEAHKVDCKQWSKIALRLPGRTDTVIKNVWNATKRRLHTRRNKTPDGTTLPTSSNTLENYMWSIREDENLPKTYKSVDATADKDQPAPNFYTNNKNKGVQSYELSDDDGDDDGDDGDDNAVDADGKFSTDLNTPLPSVDESSTSVYIPTEPTEHVSYTPWSGDIKEHYKTIDDMWVKLYGEDFTF